LRQNYAKNFVESASTCNDCIRDEERVYWYPYWGAFYWVTNGRLILKIDNGFSTADADVVDPALDPCQTDQPIFLCSGLSDADCITHRDYDLEGSNADLVDHVWVFKFMYMIVSGTYDNYIYKVSGNPRATTSTLSIDRYITSFSSTT
jgi:hypothetical protein